MTTGYKATYDYKCLDQLYEIGQEYKIEEKPIICQKGFHYCKNALDVIQYYPTTPFFKLLEIEDLSDETIHQGNKSCSNHIRIIREVIDLAELLALLKRNFSYDEENRKLTITFSDGAWSEYTYDKCGKQLTYNDYTGYSYNTPAIITRY